jgi:uncharacterized protein (TIGR02594 family)
MSTTFVSAKYDPESLTVNYVQADGTHVLRTGGTIAWRFNNPGNIRPPRAGAVIMGAIGIGTSKSNGSFLIFASYEAGRAQKKSLLRRKYNERTIYTMLAGVPDKSGDLVQGYAPASDNNDPEAYAQAISKHTGFPVDKVLSELTDEELDKVLDAMEIKEGFHGKKETRKEVSLAATAITITDGAVGMPDVTIKIKTGTTAVTKKTNQQGQLPLIAHTIQGQKVEIHSLGPGGEWIKRLEFIMSNVSKSFILLDQLLKSRGTTAPKALPEHTRPGSRRPLRYIVRADDTIARITRRYKCSVSSLKEWNPEFARDNKIFPGQVLGIYGRVSAAAKHRRRAKDVPAVATRSKEGSGEPLAVMLMEHRQAPWMVTAIDEGKRWAGRDEAIINSSRNYHRESGSAGTLQHTPWCASFVNYCLMESGSLYMKSASSQFPVHSRKFVRIEEPVYGALMVLRNYCADTGEFVGTGHVTFVYGRTNDGKIAGLGGNQGDTVRISVYAQSGISSRFTLHRRAMHQKFFAFYIPASYVEYAKKEGSPMVVDPGDVNRTLLGIRRAAVTANENTR